MGSNKMMSKISAFLDSYAADNPKYIEWKKRHLKEQNIEMKNCLKKDSAEEVLNNEMSSNSQLPVKREKSKIKKMIAKALIGIMLWPGFVTTVNQIQKENNLTQNKEKVQEYESVCKKIANEIRNSGVNTKDIVEISKAIEVYLWEMGIEGNKLKYTFEYEHDIYGLFGYDIAAEQKGVCRHIAFFVSDVLKEFGYYTKNILTYMPVENDSTLNKMKPNHQIIVVDMEKSELTSKEREDYDRFVYIDPTNISMGYEQDGIIKMTEREDEVRFIAGLYMYSCYEVLESMKIYLEDRKEADNEKNKVSLSCERQKEVIKRVRFLLQEHQKTKQKEDSLKQELLRYQGVRGDNLVEKQVRNTERKKPIERNGKSDEIEF